MTLSTSPAPAGPAAAAEAALWSSFDGARFPFSSWLPKGDAGRGATIVCVHGLSGAAADYRQLGERLSADGHAVYAYELRGQGNDPEKERVGDIRKAEFWFADLDSFVTHARQQHPGRPVFLYGESLGALIVMHGFRSLAPDNRAAVRGLIYGSPVVALPGELPPLRNFLLRVLIKVCPGMKISLRRLAGDSPAQVTGDDEVDHWAQMEKTPYFVPRLTFRMLGTVEALVKSSAAAAAPIDKPVLVLYPGKDVFTTPPQVEAFFKQLQSKDKTEHLFEDSHHLLFYDDQRDELFKLVRDWVGKRQ